jgi:hypothetical protein
MFPPGRGRLVTCPRPTGSAWLAKMIGTVFVACRARSTSVEDVAKITAALLATSSAAASCSLSTESAKRASMIRFCPST